MERRRPKTGAGNKMEFRFGNGDGRFEGTLIDLIKAADFNEFHLCVCSDGGNVEDHFCRKFVSHFFCYPF
jgi:hypothetical protein